MLFRSPAQGGRAHYDLTAHTQSLMDRNMAQVQAGARNVLFMDKLDPVMETYTADEFVEVYAAAQDHICDCMLQSDALEAYATKLAAEIQDLPTPAFVVAEHFKRPDGKRVVRILHLSKDGQQHPLHPSNETIYQEQWRGFVPDADIVKVFGTPAFLGDGHYLGEGRIYDPAELEFIHKHRIFDTFADPVRVEKYCKLWDLDWKADVAKLPGGKAIAAQKKALAAVQQATAANTRQLPQRPTVDGLLNIIFGEETTNE